MTFTLKVTINLDNAAFHAEHYDEKTGGYSTVLYPGPEIDRILSDVVATVRDTPLDTKSHVDVRLRDINGNGVGKMLVRVDS
jgi:hypothetical protein